jgi:deoxyribodipyrimidine photo-lyase
MAAAIFWFRQDLRLADNAGLSAAIEAGGRDGVVPVYVWAPEEEQPFAPGAASRVWLHASLAALDGALRAKGSRLVVRAGPTREALVAVAREVGARAVFWNRRYEPPVVARDAALARALESQGYAVGTGRGLPSANLLFEPEALTSASGAPFQRFGPFWRACLLAPAPAPPTAAPRTLPAPPRWPAATPLEALALLPRVPWDTHIRAHWTPGEEGAGTSLRRFVRERLGAYTRDRDRLDTQSGSRLSPHLHFGEIGAREVWYAVRAAAARRRLDDERFLRELAWHELAYHVLHHFPRTATESMQPLFRRFPWANDPAGLRAWQRGETGYPLVDAGMRELWATGFVANRLRMVLASFLVKHLLLPWQEGAAWFWDTLVDADLADNALNWQWCAGSGVDAAPFFRIFNPVLQGQTYDPDGTYVRRWLPELAKLPARFIHAPWTAPGDVLALAAVKLGRSYPRPIVDHHAARARALAALEEARAAAGTPTPRPRRR